MRIIRYNRLNAVNYAKKWAFGRNPEYYNFDYLGGDCTNFVSQCLYAGSGVMNYTPTFGWYYISLSNRAPAWTGVQYLYNFLTTNQSYGPFAEEVSENETQIGDIIQLGREDGSFYHSLIITETTPRILIAAHTNDALNRPLSSYNYYRARFVHIRGVIAP